MTPPSIRKSTQTLAQISLTPQPWLYIYKIPWKLTFCYLLCLRTIFAVAVYDVQKTKDSQIPVTTWVHQGTCGMESWKVLPNPMIFPGFRFLVWLVEPPVAVVAQLVLHSVFHRCLGLKLKLSMLLEHRSIQRRGSIFEIKHKFNNGNKTEDYNFLY